MTVRLNLTVPIKGAVVQASQPGESRPEVEDDRYLGTPRGGPRARQRDPLAPGEVRRPVPLAENRVPATITARVRHDRENGPPGRTPQERALALARAFPLSGDRREDAAVYRYADAMTLPADEAPAPGINHGPASMLPQDVRSSAARQARLDAAVTLVSRDPARLRAVLEELGSGVPRTVPSDETPAVRAIRVDREQQILAAVERADHLLKDAPPAERQRFYEWLRVQPFARLTVERGEAGSEGERRAGASVIYSGQGETAYSIADLAAIRIDRASLDAQGVTAEDPATMRRYLESYRSSLEARGMDPRVVDQNVAEEFGRYLQAYFVHHGTGASYDVPLEQRVARLPSLIADMRVGSFDRRVTDCEGFHYLTQSVLGGLGMRTETVQLPLHVATLVTGRDGAQAIVNNERVTAVPAGADAVPMLLDGGRPVAYSLSAWQGGPWTGRYMYVPGRGTRPQTETEQLAFDLREHIASSPALTNPTAVTWESWLGIRRELGIQ